MQFWTQEKVDILRRQWIAGTSVRVIAGMLGGSRNTVIGKANRLDLPTHACSRLHPDRHGKRRNNKSKLKKLKGMPRARRIKRIATQISSPSRRLQPPTLQPPRPLASPISIARSMPEALRISFADLAPHHCRYAVSAHLPHLFCGHARQGRSAFCAFHHAICYEKPREKPRRNPHLGKERTWPSLRKRAV